MAEHQRRSPKSPLDHKPAAVRRARERLGYTRTELAGLVHVSVSLICEIEKGSRNATPAMILKLARELHCSPDSLRRRRLGPVQGPAPSEAQEVTQDAAQGAAA